MLSMQTIMFRAWVTTGLLLSLVLVFAVMTIITLHDLPSEKPSETERLVTLAFGYVTAVVVGLPLLAALAGGGWVFLLRPVTREPDEERLRATGLTGSPSGKKDAADEGAEEEETPRTERGKGGDRSEAKGGTRKARGRKQK